MPTRESVKGSELEIDPVQIEDPLFHEFNKITPRRNNGRKDLIHRRSMVKASLLSGI
jgi:hypothetical protein